MADAIIEKKITVNPDSKMLWGSNSLPPNKSPATQKRFFVHWWGRKSLIQGFKMED